MILTENELKQAQKIMLLILKKVDNFCKENDIKYFLHAGTMLGAVRHNGFIPWDDDIDIGMLRSDYDKFCKLFGEEQDDLILQNYSTDEGYGNQHSKLILKNTKWIESASQKTNRKYSGIFLDVFCFDKIPSDKKQQRKIYKKIKFLNFLMTAKKNYKPTFDSFLKKFLFKCLKLYSYFISSKRIKKKQLELCLNNQYLKGDCFVTNFGGDFFGNINPERYFKDLILHKFEDGEFAIPREYDKILTTAYGDYMTPPVNHSYKHEVVEYDFGPYLK